MELHGQNLIGYGTSAARGETIPAVNPATGAAFGIPFHIATTEEVDRALELAESAFFAYRSLPVADRAAFLDRIAEELLELGDTLLERAHQETALPLARLTGERGRTVSQLRMFAEVVREGSWIQARIDRGQPDRQPAPRPDLRRMLIPLGPVVVFGAGNFPLAFSVPGGDTASALAAGCPVVVKAHPAHPGTSELAARAILWAAEATGMPEGVFSMLHGLKETGLAMVRHPKTQAVGFTGSLIGGRALFDAAHQREKPIPVYAEMGSINPVFVLPGALRARGEKIAEGLALSVTQGVGQFCTNPGLTIGLNDQALTPFIETLAERLSQTAPATMLYAGIREAYGRGIERLQQTEGVKQQTHPTTPADPALTQANAAIFTTDAQTFLQTHALSEEVFGPSSLLVVCGSPEEMEAVANGLEGQLTATIHGTPEDLRDYRGLVAVLETKAGRLIFNGFPTGVEVCAAMQHGGPYPATTDSRTTSVGTAAILRFARPVCYQDFPQEALPVELQDANAHGIWRLLDGEWTRQA